MLVKLFNHSNKVVATHVIRCAANLPDVVVYLGQPFIKATDVRERTLHLEYRTVGYVQATIDMWSGTTLLQPPSIWRDLDIWLKSSERQNP